VAEEDAVTSVLDPRAAERLAKICGMFGSDHAGERAAAAAKANEMVLSLGLRWADVISVPLVPVEAPADISWQDALSVCIEHIDELDPRSQAFVRSLSRWRGEPSERQLQWLFDIHERVHGERR
jgi:hypothetical protein